MKEFSFRINKDSLHLRANSRAPLNSIQLVTSTNLKPKKEVGLVPYEPVTNITFTPSIGVSYPFPQLFKGRELTLLADTTALYSVNESTWAATAITTYDPDSEATEKAITGSGIWHFVDLGPAYMLFNGTVVVFKMNRRGAFGAAEKTFVNSVQTIQTGCYHRGRVITGGFSSNFWRGDWKEFFFSFLESSETGINRDIDFGSNWVMWSTIGGGDLLAWLSPNFGLYGLLGAHDDAKPYILEMLRKNQMGFMPLPWQGTIYRIAPLGKHVLIYGTGGVTALDLTSSPIPTYGMTHLNYRGISGRGCVGVSDDLHIYIDDSGKLWAITADLNTKKLGYCEFLHSLTNPLITYNEMLEEFIISHSGGSYILTDGGMGAAEQKVTSAYDISGTVKGVTVDPSGTRTAVATTDSFDMGIRGIKQIMCVGIGGTALGSSTVTVTVQSRFDKSSAFVEYSAIPVNKEGYAYPLVSGNEFRLKITGSNYLYSDTDYIDVRYKVLDKRGIRGIYADKNAS